MAADIDPSEGPTIQASTDLKSDTQMSSSTPAGPGAATHENMKDEVDEALSTTAGAVTDASAANQRGSPMSTGNVEVAETGDLKELRERRLSAASEKGLVQGAPISKEGS